MRKYFAERKIIPFGTNNKFLVPSKSDAQLPRVTKTLVYDPLVLNNSGQKVYTNMFNSLPPVYIQPVPFWKRLLRSITKPFLSTNY